jgi:hypothetical protein
MALSFSRRARRAKYEARLAALRAAQPAATKKAREAITPIVDPLLEAGRATLDVQIGEWTTEFRLRPKNSGAASLELEVEEGMIRVFVGEPGACKEIWQGCTPEGLEELVTCVAAVVEGKYVELVYGRGSRQLMTFGEPPCPRYKRFGGRGRYGPSRTTRYEPY